MGLLQRIKMALRGPERRWPALASEDVRRRARVVVIDDEPFAYKGLFKRDGYSVDIWRDVTDLPKLESGYYDLILLDIQGVGTKQSADQGFGILRHLKAKNPTQLIVAYSNADWSLKYRPFFDEADAVLAKSADYVDFKRTVDDLLMRRFSLEYYIDKVTALVGEGMENEPRVREAAERAILSGDTSGLRSTLRREQVNEERVNTILQATQVGIGVLQLLLGS